MRFLTPIIAFAGLFLTACNRVESNAQRSITQPRIPAAAYEINAAANTIAVRFPPPPGYSRAPAKDGAFATFLRTLPLKPHGSSVLTFNGTPKSRQDVHAAIVDLDVGRADLQQCADAVMRLRAEYLFGAGKADEIAFNFTSGFRAGFTRWSRGERIVVKGGVASWRPGGEADRSHASLRRFLNVVYSYAGTLSLAKELKPVRLANLQPGDVFIHGGSPGHAVIVVDVAQNDGGEKVFLLAQSYMPAQDIHILHNPAKDALSPWYKLDTSAAIIETPEWDFSAAELRRFPGE